MQLSHAHGLLIVDQGDVVNHTVGKNLVTRKDWEKDERIPASQFAGVLVVSRDRREFGLDGRDQSGKGRLHVEGIKSKADLDAFMHDLAAANPSCVIELAHPSYGLADPVHENAVKAAVQATKFNEDERKRREAAAARRPEAKAKTYDHEKDYRKDAPKMARDGWVPEGQTGTRGGVSLGGTAAKFLLTGGLGAITGFSHKGDKISVTWMKPPTPYTPREYAVVPPIPEPRKFSHESYFSAKLVDPVKADEEFSVGSATPMAGSAPAPVAPAPVAADSVTPVPVVQSASITADTSAAPVPSVPDKLRQLAALRDEGIITAEEFESAKAKLLASL
jgi:hypothetical protein